jgi:NAD/NADP transhydrogenase beta subunit
VKKTVWITFAVALILINLLAWLTEQATGIHVDMILRLAMVLGIVVGSIAFAGAFALVSKFEEERPLTGPGKNTLQERLSGEKELPPQVQKKPEVKPGDS